MEESIDFSNPAVREQIARQYQPLVYKIARQQFGKTALCPDDVIGFAEMGLVDAMNTYRSDKGQTFKQYLGYRILYFIQNNSNEYGHIVKFSAYMQNKAREAGQSTWIRKSIDMYVGDDGHEYSNIPIPSYEESLVNEESVFNNLFSTIERKFNARDCNIFYRVYGLNGFEQTKGTELAKEYNCSGTNITLITKKIIKYIRTQKELLEELKDCFKNL